MAYESIRIPRVDGSDLFGAAKKGESFQLATLSKKGFAENSTSLLPFCLDLHYLKFREALKTKRVNAELYSEDFITVTFKYSCRFDENGNMIKPKKEGERTGKLPEPNETYSPRKIREYLYENGFVANGTHYVRYKRSSGSARTGKCLFIRKKLFSMMDRWSNAKLKPADYGDNLVSFEAYRALSLSSLMGVLELNPYNILVVKDHEATLRGEKVARVYEEDGKLRCEETECDIGNKIWDGEGLLDASVFKSLPKRFADKSFLLLRNRFFKSCAFNTNLQKWFKEKGITHVSQLKGTTSARDITDIKLVITESSLKYLKLVKGGLCEKNFERWCQAISGKDGLSTFGIVKTDEPSRFFYGDMVETTYQLLNTLDLRPKGIQGLLQWNIDQISKIRDIKNNPEYAKLHLRGQVAPMDDETDIDEEGVLESEDGYEEGELDALSNDLLKESAYTLNKRICNILLDVNGDIVYTTPFRHYIYEDVMESLWMKLYKGRVLVHGTYETLCGNPYELLLHIIGKFDGNSAFLGKNEVCTSFFDDGADLVGSRAPHATMANVFRPKNHRDASIEKWFNFRREVVIVDAINNNIQHRLNGADYDSDTMLLTDDPSLLEASKNHMENFLVPYADFNELESKEKKTNTLAEIDHQIANNQIGTIFNYIQLLNSYYWDERNKRRFDDEWRKGLFSLINRLACLSGAEIDRAKRSFGFSTDDMLLEAREAFKGYGITIREDSGKGRRPLFFFLIGNAEKASSVSHIESYIGEHEGSSFKTPMDYLWKYIKQGRNESGNITKTSWFVDLLKKPKKRSNGGSQYKVIDSIIEAIDKIYEARTNSRRLKWKDDDYELQQRDFQQQVSEVLSSILSKHLRDPEKVRLALIRMEDRFDKEKGAKKAGYTKKILLLIYLTCAANYPKHKEYLASLFNSAPPIKDLVLVKDPSEGSYSLYNRFYYKAIAQKR